MTPERYARLDLLFNRAIELGAVERTAFLDQVCGTDEELRNEIERLIVAHSQRENILDSPAINIVARSLAAEERPLIGKRFGHYEVLAWLGSGGMGEVYLAKDLILGRR